MKQQLLRRQLAVEDVALGQAELLLQIPRGEHLAEQDGLLEPRTVLGQRVDHGIAERLAPLRPILRTLLDVVRSVLDETGDDVLTRRRHARIDEGRNHDVEVGSLGEVAVLGLVVRLFEIVDARGNGDVATEVTRAVWPA